MFEMKVYFYGYLNDARRVVSTKGCVVSAKKRLPELVRQPRRGGAQETRTPHLNNAIVALYQMS